MSITKKCPKAAEEDRKFTEEIRKFQNTPRYRCGEPCPWGEVQATQFIATGIIHVITGGHGGYRLCEDRYNSMPLHLRECSYTKDQWFEEDCSWCAVVLAWPQYFSTMQVLAARDTYARYFKKDHDIPDFMRGHPVELD